MESNFATITFTLRETIFKNKIHFKLLEIFLQIKVIMNLRETE